MMCQVIIEDGVSRRMTYLLDDEDFSLSCHGQRSLTELHDQIARVLGALATQDDTQCARLDNPLVHDLTSALCGLVMTLQGESEIDLLRILRLDSALRISFSATVTLA